jgi:hypothetical protein
MVQALMRFRDEYKKETGKFIDGRDFDEVWAYILWLEKKLAEHVGWFEDPGYTITTTEAGKVRKDESLS